MEAAVEKMRENVFPIFIFQHSIELRRELNLCINEKMTTERKNRRCAATQPANENKLITNWEERLALFRTKLLMLCDASPEHIFK